MNPPVQGNDTHADRLRPEDAMRLRRLARRYQFLRELGRGGMAVVYLARDRELGREVAVKVIHAQHADDAETVSRMEREARTVARLDHSSIVTLYEARHLPDGSLALVMQYVPGATLREAIRRDGPFPFPRAVRVLRDLADALAYAHGRRIVHRDVKPGNIYLDEETGRALLADFGIARWADAEELTLEGTAMGTPTYMSPEQVDGAVVDGRSDLYSLGLVGYELLTARRPWEGETIYSTIYKQKNEAIPPLAALRPDTPPHLAAAIEGALHKDRDARWQSAEEFLAQLTGAATALRPARTPPQPLTAASAPLPGDQDPTIRYRPDLDPAAPAGPARPRRWRSPRLAAAVGGAVLLLAGAVGAATGLREPDAPAPGPLTALAPRVAAPPPARTPRVASGSLPAPARLAALDGMELEGRVGEALAGPVAVRVVDAAGAPVPGVEVRFQAGGGGRVAPTAARTDSLGVARAEWTLGREAAEQTLAARAAGIADPLRLRARGMAAGPARIRAAAGDAQEGTAGQVLGDSLAVRVEDAFGNPVAGVRVRFRAANGGSVAPEWVATDSAGRAAAAWKLGAGAGRAAAEAVAGSGPALRVRFAASAAAPEPRLPAAPVARIAAGGTHTCSLGPEGQAYCWGGNDRGQLGTGETERRSTPTPVGARLRFSALSGGILHTCALARGGTAYCWGANENGQLGDGSFRPRTGPVRVAGGRSFSALGAGSAHTCALADGAAYCWGSNTDRQLGSGGGARSTPARVEGSGFRGLAVGWNHACALDARGRALCWGANARGQLGDGTRADQARPVAAEVEGRLVAVAAGGAHTCALTGDGEAWCWGRNDRGQLGDGTRADRGRPAAVRGGLRFGSITTGGVHTCALAGDGEAWCWGRNDRGQLGDGTTTDRAAPVPVSGGLRFASLHASGAHTCGVTTSGRSYCWGYNVEGQLGDGTRTHRPRPVAVARPRE